MTTNRPLRVFLCHSSADKPAVRELYQKLRAEPWIQPWLDEEELFPGMDWNLEIEKAIEATDVILVCLSKNSITKEGYVQKEIRIALDYADYKPEGTLFIIPVRLEECVIPKRLARWHYADYFDGQGDHGFDRIVISLTMTSDTLGIKITPSVSKIKTVTVKKPSGTKEQGIKEQTKSKTFSTRIMPEFKLLPEERKRAEKFANVIERSNAYRLYKKQGNKLKLSEFEFRNMLFATMEASSETLSRNLELFKRYVNICNKQNLWMFLSYCEYYFWFLLSPAKSKKK